MRFSTGPAVTIILIASFSFLYARSASEWGGELSTEQKDYPRVRNARTQCAAKIDTLFSQNGLEYPARIFLRAFKLEKELELWAFSDSDSSYILLRTYAICVTSGTPGPKRIEGDFQIPEGFYKIIGFNPVSSFHLSLKIDYPNSSDKILSDHTTPGGEIYIHGSCVTIGCIPITDEFIKELYVIVLDSKDAGFAVPVHIFPCKMDSSACIEELGNLSEYDENLKMFWENIKIGYDFFEKNAKLPKISATSDGSYNFE